MSSFVTPILSNHLQTTNTSASVERLHFYSKGEMIPIYPESIWQVYQGIVQLTVLYPDGEEGVIGWAGPGMCFGAWMHSWQADQAVGLSDVCLMRLSLSEVENSPQLSQEILPKMMRRLRQAECLMAISGQRRVEERLQQLLILLKHEFGQPIELGIKINIRLTHQDLANAICTTRVTVTRVIGKWQKEGWLTRDRDRFLIIKSALTN